MFEWLTSVLPNSEKIAILVGTSALVFSVLSSLLAHRAADTFGYVREMLKEMAGASLKRQRTQDSAYRPPVATPSQVAKERALTRIEEAKHAFRKQISSEKWSRISGNSLTVGQYVIGGLLASSFVQESLSSKVVGFLGILVLLASLIKQHFHPELSAEKAQKKAAQLKALIRTSEDQLTILDAKIAGGQDHTDAMISLLMKITERLTEIESPDVIEQRPALPEQSA